MSSQSNQRLFAVFALSKLGLLPALESYPDSPFSILNGLLDVAILFCTARIAGTKSLIENPLTAALLLWVAIHIAQNPSNTLSTLLAAARLGCPLLILNSITHTEPRLNTDERSQWSRYTIGIICLGTVIGVTLLPPERENNETLPGTFFGGLHTQSYIALIAAFLIANGPQRREPRFETIILAIITVAIVYLWRTITVALLVSYYIAIRRFANAMSASMAFSILLATTLPILGLAVYATNEVPDSFGSGRIGVYRERIYAIQSSTGTDLLTGQGPGADIRHSQIWWWAPKGSHSDLLTITIEFGLPILALSILTLYTALKRAGTSDSARIICALTLSSWISNGLLLRPALTYMCALLLIVLPRDASRRTNRRHPANSNH